MHDVHCHFFSSRFFAALGSEKLGTEASHAAETAAGQLGWELFETAESLADRWIDELNRHKVSRASLISSVHGDEESVARAVASHPNRFVGLFALNLLAHDAVERAERAMRDLALRCVCLFPAMHHYRLDDERVVRIFEVAAANRGAVFVHCGSRSRRVPGWDSRAASTSGWVIRSCCRR